MAHPRLRVYFGPDDSTEVESVGKKPAEECVRVSLGEILPLLADAVQSHRTWLQDFEDDPVAISADLYEVLMAYRQLRPTA